MTLYGRLLFAKVFRVHDLTGRLLLYIRPVAANHPAAGPDEIR
jgi:hypothetical protein